MSRFNMFTYDNDTMTRLNKNEMKSNSYHCYQLLLLLLTVCVSDCARSHLQDLKEVTHNIHYETYRAKRLNENGGLHPISCSDTQESNL